MSTYSATGPPQEFIGFRWIRICFARGTPSDFIGFFTIRIIFAKVPPGNFVGVHEFCTNLPNGVLQDLIIFCWISLHFERCAPKNLSVCFEYCTNFTRGSLGIALDFIEPAPDCKDHGSGFSWISLNWYLLGTVKHAVLYSRAWHAAHGYSWPFLSPRLFFLFVRGYSLLSVGIRGDLCSMAISFAVHGYLFSVSWLLVAILAIRGYSWLFH